MTTTATTRPDLDSDEMPGTRANPMPPGATRADIDEARRAWAERDPLTQEQRNERAAAAAPTVADAAHSEMARRETRRGQAERELTVEQAEAEERAMRAGYPDMSDKTSA